MQVLSLFDGISSGQIALERLGIKVDNYFASEIDKYAIQVTMKNYPNTIQLGDVRNIDYGKLPKIDLVIGGSPCFVAGTKVLTNTGYKNIEDIIEGDYVYTHKNRFKKVIRTGNSLSKTVILSSQGIKDTETTENHPYYIRKMKRVWNNERRCSERTFFDPEWKEVSLIEKDDFIGIPIIKDQENPLNLTEEDCWIIGRYIADGHLEKRKRKNRINSWVHKVVLSIGDKKIRDISDNVKSRSYSLYKHSTSTYRCVFSSFELLSLIEDLDIGNKAFNKRFSYKILSLPNNLLKIVLDGYMSGDGCKIGDLYKANSISEELIMSINLAIAKVYRVNSSFYYTERPKTTEIEGRTVNQKDTYSVYFRKEIKSQSNAFVDENYIWVRYKNTVHTDQIKKVFNLEVEEDNSYTANNAIVHNCQDLSIAKSNREGLNGSKSSLFWEYVRAIKETKPKYFLLENVARMPKEAKEIITNALGVEPIRINSSLLSAQLRDRLYWTNIKNVEKPEDKGILLNDILESGYCDRDKSRAILESESRPLVDPARMLHRYYKTGFTTIVFEENGIRYFTQRELERLQTLPEGYTSILTRNQAASVIGNGWTVDVIAHILKGVIDDSV